MTRTADRFYADAPHSGGWLFANARDLGVIGSVADPALTRNAQGDYSLNRTAGAAETIRAHTGLGALRRLNEPMAFQQEFGGAQGPIPLAGRPPFTDATQLVPPTTWPAKGIRIDDVVVVYEVGVVALTSGVLRMDGITFVNVTTQVITNIPITSAALAVGTDADPRVETKVITTPAFIETDVNDIVLEAEFVMANTGTLRIYGLGLHVSFNYD